MNDMNISVKPLASMSAAGADGQERFAFDAVASDVVAASSLFTF